MTTINNIDANIVANQPDDILLEHSSSGVNTTSAAICYGRYTSFTVASEITINALDWFTKKVSGVNVRAGIWNMSGSTPSTEIVSSEYMDGATLSSDYDWNEFTFSEITLSPGTYAAVFEFSDKAAHYQQFDNTTSGYAGNKNTSSTFYNYYPNLFPLRLKYQYNSLTNKSTNTTTITNQT